MNTHDADTAPMRAHLNEDIFEGKDLQIGICVKRDYWLINDEASTFLGTKDTGVVMLLKVTPFHCDTELS